ncbi:MAG TPA: DUF3108 domain-containing protein [Xanthobacteraceae bacterium]|nr:DUF3108 domain-containing protein [Xanthobacteraceae bacterium]
MRLHLPGIAALALLAAGTAGAARADGRLEARYRMSVAGIVIGQSEIGAVIGSTDYASSARGRASGVLRVLVTGEGSVSARGAVVDGRLVPASFASRTVGDDETATVTMTLAGGDVKELSAETSAPDATRVPVTADDRRGIVDPLTAFLIAVGGDGDVIGPQACGRSLPIFDGRRRYDLALAFKRVERVKADKGYAGAAVVCAVAFTAIAGYRPDSALVKYLAGGRDIELTLAPIAGTRLLAPFRLAIMNMLGDIVIEATAFETTATPAAPK